MEKSRFLIVYNEDPHGRDSGGNIRVRELARCLSDHFEVEILHLPSPDPSRPTSGGWNLPDRILMGLLNTFNRRPELINQHFEQRYRLRQMLQVRLQERKFDYIQAEHSYLAGILKGLKTKATRVINFHNIHTFMEAYAKEAKSMERYERSLNKACDLAICCSEIESEHLEFLGFPNRLVVPNGVSLPENPFNEASTQAGSLLYVGKYSYPPNAEAAEFFVREILPHLQTDVPVNFVGDRQGSSLPDGPNVTYHGYVEDLDPFFDNAIFICPILSGGGTRLKVLQAFARGAPVVATEKAVEGIDCRPGQHYILAETPEDFALSIQKLIMDPRLFQKIRLEARKLAEEKYSWRMITQSYAAELKIQRPAVREE
jgi:glycosyltransferase involved in cell wall biosynthesis